MKLKVLIKSESHIFRNDKQNFYIANANSTIPPVSVAGAGMTLRTRCTPPLKKAIPQSLGSLFPQKPHSERTPADSEYDVG